MSFGQTDALVGARIADLRDRRVCRVLGRAAYPRGARPVAGHDITHRLGNRIGVGLVEVGLHLMVRARQSSRPVPGRSALLTRSSAARGR
jgi:hypothetical protein